MKKIFRLVMVLFLAFVLVGCGGGSKEYMDIEKRKKEYISAFVSEYDSEIVEVTKNLWKSKKVVKN